MLKKHSLSSAVITNFAGNHSAGSNCEEDENDGALNNLRELLHATQDAVEEEIIDLSALR